MSKVMKSLVLGVLILVPTLAYSQELVGKTFWCTKAEVHGVDCDGEARYAPHKIVGYRVNLVEYEIETNGLKKTFLASDVATAVHSGHLVPYSPEEQKQRAAKAKAAVAKKAADRVTQVKARVGHLTSNNQSSNAKSNLV
jgi:hypothetical protein